MKHSKNIYRTAFLAALFLFSALGIHAQTKAPKEKNEYPALPNLTLNTIEGEKWSLHDDRGKTVLLNFWATWCPPCREEVPALVRLSEKYKTNGLKIVGISLDSENVALINKFINDFKINYPVVLTVPGSLLSRQETVPVTLLVDKDSRLIKKYVGAADEELLEKDIRELLELKPLPKKAVEKKPVVKKNRK